MLEFVLVMNVLDGGKGKGVGLKRTIDFIDIFQ